MYDHINSDLAGWTRNGDRLVIYNPDGSKFLTYLELAEQVESERDRAEVERVAKEEALMNLSKLAEKLRSLGIDPDQLEA